MACNQQTIDANMRRITRCSIKITLIGDAGVMAGQPPQIAQAGNDGRESPDAHSLDWRCSSH